MLPLRLLLFASLCLVSVEAQSSYDDFQKALRAERSEGDLEKAIEFYERVVTKADSRSLAARAQLRIGMCYEKMGLKEAQEAYQKVIQAYPKQNPEVTIARERLDALAKAAERTSLTPRFRTIRIPGNLERIRGPQLSPDGLRLAFVSKGAIWYLPVHGQVDPNIAGKPVQLTDPVGGEYGLSWSADGRWIAFGAVGERLYVVRTDNGALSEIPVHRRLSGDPNGYRMSLSPDGSVLAYSSAEDRGSHIYIVPVSGGTPIQLTDSWTREPAFSPDGSKIVYVKLNGYPRPDETVGEIRVISSTGGTPVRVSRVVGRVRSPIWSPDGGMIAFVIEPDKGGMEICFVSVSTSGEPLEPTRTLEIPRPTYHFLAGWTPEDTIGIPVTTPIYPALYTVPSSGGKALQVSRRSRTMHHPRWSPDGRRIYFRWGRGDIAFIPAEGGNISVIEKPAENRIVEATSGGGNAVSPDGSTIVFSAGQEGVSPVRVHIWIMPVDGGTPTELTGSPHQDRFPCWSADGETIAFVRAEEHGRSVEFNIWMVSAYGGEAEQFTAESDKVAWSPISWSPDGNLLAYFSNEKTLRVISVAKGESKDVVKVTDRDSHCELDWSPKSDEIAYTSNGRIWKVSLSDGIPRLVETGFDGRASNIDWSPNGEAFAFRATTGGETVLMLMEDFLPALNNR